jgi:large subunit ribosomal protein L5
MNFLEHFYLKTLKYDLNNRFLYKNTKELPKLKKIMLNFGCKTSDLKQLSASLLALELITNQKSKLTRTKYSNIFIKIRKGNPTGCKITLRKNKLFNFFAKTLTEIFPKEKNFNGFIISEKIKKNVFSYEIHNTFSFSQLESHYYLFNNLPKLNITIVTDTKTKKELLFILRSLKFPFKNS